MRVILEFDSDEERDMYLASQRKENVLEAETALARKAVHVARAMALRSEIRQLGVAAAREKVFNLIKVTE